MNNNILSVVEKETPLHKTVTTKTEHDCYCHGAWSLPKEIQSKVTPYNCPCQEKLDKFRKESELNEYAAEREFLKQINFGPCIECKGTGRVINTTVTRHAKYLCVNGPQEGMRYTTEKMEKIDPNYLLYNSNRRADPQFKCVWVWEKSLLD